MDVDCSNVLREGNQLAGIRGPSDCGNLQQIVQLPKVGALQNMYVCYSDQDCNGASGAGSCTISTGRCRCVLDPASGISWGGRDCSIKNHHMEEPPHATKGHSVLAARYAESRFSNYYRQSSASLFNTSWDAPVSTMREHGKQMSGPGSTAEQTVGVRRVLPILLRDLNISTIIDAPCGDFNYIREILRSPIVPPLHYIGLDIVQSLILELKTTYRRTDAPFVDFMHFDILRQALWPADLIIVRDLLFHFEARRVWDALTFLESSGSKFLLMTSFGAPYKNNVTASGYHFGRGFSSFWEVNLQDQPFSLPPPLLAIGRDGPNQKRSTPLLSGRYVGLWRLPLWPHRNARPPRPHCEYHSVAVMHGLCK